MVPSEAEIEARLAELRRRRDALDREIADHLLYLELGRRLRGVPAAPADAPASADRGHDGSGSAPEPIGPAWAPAPPHPQAVAPEEAGWPARSAPGSSGTGSGAGGPASHPRIWPFPDAAESRAPQVPARPGPHPGSPARPAGLEAAPGPAHPPGAPHPARQPLVPPAVAFETDPAGARRYGRALVDAALAILAETGRPMHAGELLEHLTARGFTLPGGDPVAALNTRLWKRAAPGGPLRRLGDAIYDLADGPGSAASFGIF